MLMCMSIYRPGGSKVFPRTFLRRENFSGGLDYLRKALKLMSLKWASLLLLDEL